MQGLPSYKPMKMTELEQTMLFHIRALNLPVPEIEHRFHGTRKWRFDFAWPDLKIACEIEGGTHAKRSKLCPCCKQPPRSRHTTGVGFAKDAEKYNEAVILGWSVIRVTSDMIKSGKAIEQLERMIKTML